MAEPFRVLIAVDGSANALAAARCWATWPTRSAHPLAVRLLAVVPPLPPSWPATTTAADPHEAALHPLARRALSSARECFATTRLVWDSAARFGAPSAVIVEESLLGQADLIVMGSRGLTALGELVLGSVALRVAQTSRVPVWLMPLQAPPPPALGRRLRLLVAVDGSPHANAAAIWAARSAQRFGDTHVELLSVQPPFSLLEGLLDATAHRFEHWGQHIGQAAIDSARNVMPAGTATVGWEVRTGEATASILARAAEIDADAIVVGPRGLGAAGRALLGSVTSALLQTAQRTVIVVPDASD